MANQISTATNLSAPNLSNDPNNAAKYFNNFISINFSIGAANDAIVAYFEEKTGDTNSGQALAGAVIYTAQMQGLDPMKVLADFQKMSNNELNNYLAAFLNFNRVPSSQLGIRQTSNSPNPVIARTILP
jgi:hypothetical protein